MDDIQYCSRDCNLYLFADDVNVFVSGKTVPDVINKANNCMCDQGSSRTGTHGNAIPVLFLYNGNVVPVVFFCILQLLTVILSSPIFISLVQRCYIYVYYM